MNERYQQASNALNQLGNSATINAKHLANQIIKIYTQFEEIRYISETIPDFILHSDTNISIIKDSGEIRVAQLLASILCDQISDHSQRLVEQLEFGEIDTNIREEILEVRNQVLRLKEVVEVQKKIADGAPVSTDSIRDLQKKYESRIDQLERELLRKEGRALTVTALDATEKPKIFGKGKFIDNLADLVLEYGKSLRASSGGYISMANLYTALKNQVPDIKFSVKDLEKACNAAFVAQYTGALFLGTMPKKEETFMIAASGAFIKTGKINFVKCTIALKLMSISSSIFTLAFSSSRKSYLY